VASSSATQPLGFSHLNIKRGEGIKKAFGRRLFHPMKVPFCQWKRKPPEYRKAVWASWNQLLSFSLKAELRVRLEKIENILIRILLFVL
jgi:hypothetical protein